MEKSPEIVIPINTDWITKVTSEALMNMRKYDSCTQSVLAAFMKQFNIDNSMVMRSAGAMLGGMVSSLTCGIHTSAMMIMGLLMGRENLEDGIDGLLPIVVPAQELVQRLNHKLGSHSCKELTGVDFTDLEQAMKFRMSNEHERCIERVGEGARVIGEYIEELKAKGALFRPKVHNSSP